MIRTILPIAVLIGVLSASTAQASGEGDSGLRAELQNPSLIQPGHDASRIEHGYTRGGPERYGGFAGPRGTWTSHRAYRRPHPYY